MMTILYEIYRARCNAIQKQFSIYKFTECFKNLNYSLFKRKKDLCNIEEEEYEEHQKRKEEGLPLKEEDKCLTDNVYKSDHSRY